MANHLDSLPNELLLNVLDHFPTHLLLPLAAVSLRFRKLVGRLQYYRLVQTLNFPDHELHLESYLPSDKLYTPSLFTEYTGTDGFDEAGDEADVRVLNQLYSRFKLFLNAESRRPRARWPTARMVEGLEELPADVPAPSYGIELEPGQLFTQLCVVVNLLKLSPVQGLFLSVVSVDHATVRVWRDWLREQADRPAGELQGEAGKSLDDSSILWTGSSKTVGVRFRVSRNEQRSQREMPLLVDSREELAEYYRLEYLELIIRTNRLLLKFEESETQQVVHSGSFYYPGAGFCHTVIQLPSIMPVQ
ncbi:hypothetical protein F5Y17DRAFT_421701 [Xylariaceae sp. FL0594]|nr:hypothetical protein F5Y17DRAFT_421701 [Xylariaceae sp. FL0594]